MDEIKAMTDGFQAQLGSVQQDIGTLQLLVWHLLKQSSPHLCLDLSFGRSRIQASPSIHTVSDTICVQLGMSKCIYLCVQYLSQQVLCK